MKVKEVMLRIFRFRRNYHIRKMMPDFEKFCKKYTRPSLSVLPPELQSFQEKQTLRYVFYIVKDNVRKEFAKDWAMEYGSDPVPAYKKRYYFCSSLDVAQIGVDIDKLKIYEK